MAEYDNDYYIQDEYEVETHTIVADEPGAHIDGGPGTYYITVSGDMKLYASVANAIGAPLIDETCGVSNMIFTVVMNEGESCIVTVTSADGQAGNFSIDVLPEIINSDGTTDNEQSPPATSDEKEKPINQSDKNTVADPIDVSTGAHVIKNILLRLNGGKKLEFAIQYDSSCNAEGNLGRGWYHNFEKKLDALLLNTIRIYERPGRYHEYTRKADSQVYVCNTIGRFGYKLTAMEDGYCLDRNNNGKEYYDTDGRLIKMVDHQGFETLLTYTDSMIEIKDALTNSVIQLRLDENGKIDGLMDSYGRTLSFWYENGYLVRYNDLDGNEFEYTYNDDGKIYKGIDAKGICYFKNSYNANGKVSWQEDAFGAQTMFTYTENGCITNNRYGKNSTRVYNSDGLLTSYTDENGNTTTYTYNTNGLLEKETDALGHTKTTLYNAYNKPTKITDKRGNVTSYTYDEFGNLLSIIYLLKKG